MRADFAFRRSVKKGLVPRLKKEILPSEIEIHPNDLARTALRRQCNCKIAI